MPRLPLHHLAPSPPPLASLSISSSHIYHYLHSVPSTSGLTAATVAAAVPFFPRTCFPASSTLALALPSKRGSSRELRAESGEQLPAKEQTSREWNGREAGKKAPSASELSQSVLCLTQERDQRLEWVAVLLLLLLPPPLLLLLSGSQARRLSQVVLHTQTQVEDGIASHRLPLRSLPFQLGPQSRSNTALNTLLLLLSL